MPDDNSHHDAKALKPRPIKTLGKEELFDVFKTDGEAELFAKPAPKKKGTEAAAPTGPSIDHRMTDSEGPSISRNAIADADTDGPTIAHQMNDATGPIIKNAEFNDASGPTIAHQMSDANGPIIKKTEITDADGPTINHQMSDANGPVIKRVLENTIVKLPTIPNPVASITKTDVQSSEHQPENSSVSEPAHRVDTFSVHMAERIAKMKSEQKETKTKMDDLEADTQKMQVKLTKK
jgi:hypothetical protein